MAVVLAVDWGERRMGIAVCDALQILASGRPTLLVRSLADAVSQVIAVARAEEAERIVVGWPLQLSGERGSSAQAAERFASALRAACDLPVELLDERLTSSLAEQRLAEAGGRRRRDKGRIDQGAAMALLEDWMARDAVRRGAAQRSAAPQEPGPEGPA